MSEESSRDNLGRLSQPNNDHDLSTRLRRLEDRIGRVRSSSGSDNPDRYGNGNPSPIGTAVRYSAEFVGGPIVGAGIGWAADRLFGISPWGMIVMLLLGFVAGIFNVMRSAGFIPAARK